MSDETPSVDIQDPLPESNWLWRRVFVFAVTGAVLWMLWGAITRLATSAIASPERGIDALLTLCKWMIVYNILMVTYYMVAPSAEQIVKMMKTAKLLTSGVQIAGTQRVSTPESTTDTSKVAGIPPLPVGDAIQTPEILPGAAPGERFQAPGPDVSTPASDLPSWPPKEDR